MGIISPTYSSFNSEINYNERTQVQAKNAQNLAVEKGQLEDRLSVSITTIYETDTSANVGLSISFDPKKHKDVAFYVGYGSETIEERKASLSYKIKTASGKIEERASAINRKNSHKPYDNVGAIGNKEGYQTECFISYEPGEILLTDEIYLVNIFEGEKNENGNYNVYLENGKLVPLYANVSLDETLKKRNISDFIDINFAGVSKFNGYNSINLKVTNKVTPEIYSSLTSSTRRVYRQNEDDILEGKAYIRTSLLFNSDTTYLAYYKDVAEPVILTSAVSTKNVNGNNLNIEFLFSNIDAERLVDFKINNFAIQVDIFNKEDIVIIKGSKEITKFCYTPTGMKTLIDSNGDIVSQNKLTPYFINVDLIMGLSIGVFVILYEVVSISLFFYLKNKNKDDEFKRMRPKQYFKTNTMGLLTLFILIMTVESICFRLTIMNNTLPVYNSLDIFIVVGGIASILLVGYFVRYFAIQIKNVRDAKRNEKLKLNRNKMEDGTLIISSASKGE